MEGVEEGEGSEGRHAATSTPAYLLVAVDSLMRKRNAEAIRNETPPSERDGSINANDDARREGELLLRNKMEENRVMCEILSPHA